MKIDKTGCRWASLFSCVLMLHCLSGCGSKDLGREKAAELLNVEFAEKLAAQCTVNPVLQQKPEFAPIASEPLCDAEFAITGIRKVSEAAAFAEAKIVTHAREDAVRKWLEAFSALEVRLQGLAASHFECAALFGMRPTRTSDVCPHWEFVDEFDGQVFASPHASLCPSGCNRLEQSTNTHNRNTSVGVVGKQPASIAASPQWESLQQLGTAVRGWAESGSSECCSREYAFQLFDDGWRLVQDD